jgi:hypothetical protein
MRYRQGICVFTQKMENKKVTSMQIREAAVRVPIPLLRDPDLTPSAKVIWIMLRMAPLQGLSQIEAATGFSRPTIRQGLARLSITGWDPATSEHHTAHLLTVTLPVDLLKDPQVPAQAKLLYGLLALIGDGRFSYAQLSGLAGVSLTTVKMAVRDLLHAGWLRVAQTNKRAPIHFMRCNPWQEQAEAEAAQAARRLNKAPFRGEALMREYLNLLIDSRAFEDDAAPGFLVNPASGERLQLDRFYPPDVGFEFNGPQHYGETDLFTREEATQQRTRDLIKRGLCAERGLHLVVIHAEDLTLRAMQERVGRRLPLRSLEAHTHLAEFLEKESRSYRKAARRRPPDTATASVHHPPWRRLRGGR